MFPDLKYIGHGLKYEGNDRDDNAPLVFDPEDLGDVSTFNKSKDLEARFRALANLATFQEWDHAVQTSGFTAAQKQEWK